jgi:hypothetical protein
MIGFTLFLSVSVEICPDCPSGVCLFNSTDCFCAGGFSGSLCDELPLCDIVSAPPVDCPAGCDYCDVETCIVHVRNEREDPFGSWQVSCPPAANGMRCLLICDTFQCLGHDLSCNSSVSCDFVCAEPGECGNMICQRANVPCRAQCLSLREEYQAIGAFLCSNTTTSPCGVCDLGACSASSLCIAGVTCPEDPCYSFNNDGGGCLGGNPAYNATEDLCFCACDPPLVSITDETGSNVCVSDITSLNCGCEDYANICVNGTCLCAGATQGPYCNMSTTTEMKPLL